MSTRTVEQEQALRDLEDFFKDINAGICPNHQTKITLRQVGRCVYGSCGCRLYQGTIESPKVRATTVTVKPLLPRYTTTTNPTTGLRQVVKQ